MQWKSLPMKTCTTLKFTYRDEFWQWVREVAEAKVKKCRLDALISEKITGLTRNMAAHVNIGKHLTWQTFHSTSVEEEPDWTRDY